MNNLIYYIDKLSDFFPNSFIKFIVYYFIVLILIFIIPIEILESIFNINPYFQNPISNIENTKVLYLLTVGISPLIETLIFQVLLVRGIYLILEGYPFNRKSYNKRSVLFAIIVSSLVFGGLHFFSFLYIILMCILGFIFGLVFYFSAARSWRPFFPIFILHALYINPTGLYL